MRNLAACLFAGAAALLAQEPPAPPAGPQRPFLVDRVVATVNDTAILRSELLTLAAGQLRAAEANLLRRLQPPELLALLREVLAPLVQNHAMAQAAKTFGTVPPERVEQIFQDELAREEAEQVRDFGTWQEFSKELQRQGRTWQTYVRERRVDKMQQIAEELAVGGRLRNRQGNLLLTPRMLRETYQREIARFVHGPRASAELVGFEGRDGAATAAAAAELWRKEALTGQQLRERFPGVKGTSTEISGITEASRESLAPEIVDFALGGPAGAVSAPFELGGSFRVARITRHEPGRQGRFEDPDVQIALRNLCQRQVLGELRQQAIDRAMLRAETWVVPDLR
ncbi:MAG: peptidyl-prolyl cis-trans isomerase [Planctomycetes bacterium]|nr:peptidyl-prolyl cis-trans isomerase [Planctomycetota bacterium]